MTGNFVIDAPFSESYYRDPKEVSSFNFLIIIMIYQSKQLQLLMRIKMLTGVVEVGLFCGVSDNS